MRSDDNGLFVLYGSGMKPCGVLDTLSPAEENMAMAWCAGYFSAINTLKGRHL